MNREFVPVIYANIGAWSKLMLNSAKKLVQLPKSVENPKDLAQANAITKLFKL